ncbi:unnamed protein product [Toxocara canis]|uniref:Secreted protein n=1 Tax=Toxocara canis TaxID=6265 RepID=A0A183U253_TOXCA|nr:unnamed protein product [Toxocara canis]
MEALRRIDIGGVCLTWVVAALPVNAAHRRQPTPSTTGSSFSRTSVVVNRFPKRVVWRCGEAGIGRRRRNCLLRSDCFFYNNDGAYKHKDRDGIDTFD